MANNTNNNVRQIHVSPGVYTNEVDLTYASKSLGITTLGLVGETVKGPAFQPILVDSWRTYQSFFGGTNPEIFSGSGYPKYELPYIAKSYLEQSQQLQVCRVLGLSGANAGASWVITAGSSESYSPYYVDENGNGKPLVIAVLRSRGEHKKAAFMKSKDKEHGICEDVYEYDKIIYYAKDVKVIKSKSMELDDNCNPTFDTTTSNFDMTITNYGEFTLVVTTQYDEKKYYSVSLNPTDKNYILNILGTNPQNGECELFVEELYDIALKQMIEQGLIDNLNFTLDDDDSGYYSMVHYPDVKIVPSHRPVYDILTEDESMLTRRHIGRRYLYSDAMSFSETEGVVSKLKVHISSNRGKSWELVDGIPGHIYTVRPHVLDDGTRTYYYTEFVSTTQDDVNDQAIYDGKYYPANDSKFRTEFLSENHVIEPFTRVFTDAVEVKADHMFYIMTNREGQTDADVAPITFDWNNYKEQYRFASTPWIVSEIKGSAESIELIKLFRFHTISDGNSANTEVKVSITNIEPTLGTFDVVVRDFYDTDASPVVLERYTQCNLIKGTPNYLAMRIGSIDESFETKSNYITVEMNDDIMVQTCIPAGFLGYPVRNYETGTIVLDEDMKMPSVSNPYFKFNTNVDEDIRINKQYFGVSNLVGIDEDVLRYKGVEAYNGDPDGMTPCFHLDSRILSNFYKDTYGFQQTVTVDGVSTYDWSTVSKNNVTDMAIEPKIGDDETMANTIYEDKRYRKFTVAFYGGWDGWDYYRTSRSNTDDFTYQKYRGSIDLTSGEGVNFSVIRDNELYGFEKEQKTITSDYYAYLSGYRQFANPKTIDINVFATPGIDYVNNKSLVNDVVEMIETERADSVYVVTTPDMPFGGGISMYTPQDVVDNLEESELDSNYTCTYYPWVKYYDQDNSQYIYLPVTKDIVRNFAYTDNVSYPWFAAAGWKRGNVDGIKPRKSLKLSEQDELYENRINFINTFPDEGMKLWGDKNLQVRESQMNRISKRRLLVRLRKLIAIACVDLLFDPNDNTTAKAFESAVKPILQNAMTNRGITDFRIEVDTSQEARDRLSLPAKIYLKLMPNLEYISIDFVITPSGVSFDDV